MPDVTTGAAAAIGWFYLLTNAARLFTYLPQVWAVWRNTDGAQAISLLTWGSWLISHLAAIAYGIVIVHDLFFVIISCVNFCGCSAVTGIAWARRRQWCAALSNGATVGASAELINERRDGSAWAPAQPIR